jgi:hypothetical protein
MPDLVFLAFVAFAGRFAAASVFLTRFFLTTGCFATFFAALRTTSFAVFLADFFGVFVAGFLAGLAFAFLAGAFLVGAFLTDVFLAVFLIGFFRGMVLCMESVVWDVFYGLQRLASSTGFVAAANGG